MKFTLCFIYFSVLTRGWTFSRRNVEITLPEDYPLNIPFYRITILLSERDIAKNTTPDFTMKVEPFRKSEVRASAINKKEQFVKVDKNTGILTLIKKLPIPEIRGKLIFYTLFIKENKLAPHSEWRN